MKLLYCGAHGVLEYDELRALSKISQSIFSFGFYTDPSNPTPNLRPSLEFKNYDFEALALVKKNGISASNFVNHPEFLSRFDLIILVHDLTPISEITGSLPIPVVYRTIGQNDASQEIWVTHIKSRIESPFYIVRYSPREAHLPNFSGVDATIRFGKEKDDFYPRAPADGRLVTFGNGLLDRAGACNYQFYLDSTEPFARALYGNGNPPTSFSYAAVAHEEQLGLLSRASVYFCLNSLPASYTLNFMEAMAAGCAVVTPGRELIESDPNVEERVRLPQVYEVPDFLVDAPLKLAVSNVDEAQATIRALFDSRTLLEEVGEWCHKRFSQLFLSSKNEEDWRVFLNSVLNR